MRVRAADAQSSPTADDPYSNGADALVRHYESDPAATIAGIVCACVTALVFSAIVGWKVWSCRNKKKQSAQQSLPTVALYDTAMKAPVNPRPRHLPPAQQQQSLQSNGPQSISRPEECRVIQSMSSLPSYNDPSYDDWDPPQKAAPAETNVSINNDPFGEHRITPNQEQSLCNFPTTQQRAGRNDPSRSVPPNRATRPTNLQPVTSFNQSRLSPRDPQALTPRSPSPRVPPPSPRYTRTPSPAPMPGPQPTAAQPDPGTHMMMGMLLGHVMSQNKTQNKRDSASSDDDSYKASGREAMHLKAIKGHARNPFDSYGAATILPNGNANRPTWRKR